MIRPTPDAAAAFMAPIDLSRRRAMRADPKPATLPDLAAQVGSEVASTLSSALERVTALATTGRIERADLRALREEIERARLAGMMAQQLARLANGRVPLAPEPLDLTAMLREALLQRGREIESRGLTVRQRLKPAFVIGDATLTFTLLQTLLDWSFGHTRSAVEFELEQQNWPERALLTCRFAWRPVDEVPARPDAEASPLDSLSWRLLHQTAATLELPIEREDADGATALVIAFPRTIAETAPGGAAALRLGDAAVPALPTRSLEGSHVLVVAARREVRNQVREALRTLGLMVDFVTSVDEAREFCKSGMPHAVVHEAALGGEAFERLRQELLAELPTLAFVQITEDGKGFEVRAAGGRDAVCVARAAIGDSLPAALMFELSRAAR